MIFGKTQVYTTAVVATLATSVAAAPNWGDYGLEARSSFVKKAVKDHGFDAVKKVVQVADDSQKQKQAASRYSKPSPVHEAMRKIQSGSGSKSKRDYDDYLEARSSFIKKAVKDHGFDAVKKVVQVADDSQKQKQAAARYSKPSPVHEAQRKIQSGSGSKSKRDYDDYALDARSSFIKKAVKDHGFDAVKKVVQVADDSQKQKQAASRYSKPSPVHEAQRKIQSGSGSKSKRDYDDYLEARSSFIKKAVKDHGFDAVKKVVQVADDSQKQKQAAARYSKPSPVHEAQRKIQSGSKSKRDLVDAVVEYLEARAFELDELEGRSFDFDELEERSFEFDELDELD